MEKNKKTLSPMLWALIQVLYFTVMTLAFTRPLYKHLSTHIAGALGDNLYFIWQIGWFKQALFDLKQLPFLSFLLNFPYGYNLATTEIAPLQLAFALPFALGGQLVLGYNVSMLLTFVLGGLFMSYWVYHLSGSRAAGLLAGTAYAFLPYHIAHFLSGHLNISAIQWFPLYFWGFAAILTEEKKSASNVWLLAIGLSGVALTSQYYLYTTFLVSAFILLVYFLFFQRKQFLNGRIWQQFLLAGLLSLPALAVGVVPYVLVHRGGEPRSLQDVMQFSAGLSDYLLPATRHFLWGKWVGNNFPRDLWNEATLYLGLPVTALAVLAFLQRKHSGQRRLFQLFATGFVISLVLSMGTNLTWMEQPLRVDPNSWLGYIFNDPDGLVYLPGYFFFKTIPYYDIMRAWMRIGVFAMLFNCAAAGLGLAWLLQRWPKRQVLLAGLGLSLVLLDFYVSPNSLSVVKPRAVDLWLAQQPYGGQVQLPLKQSYEEYSLYYTLTSQKPIISVIRTFPSNRYFELNPLLANFPDPTSVAALQEQQLTYVVLDEQYYPLTDDFIAKCEALGMQFQISLEGQAVFTLPGSSGLQNQ